MIKGFYRVRDLFFGQNFQIQNIPKALELAPLIDHPETQWLTRIFYGRLNEDPIEVLKEQEDVRAYYYLGTLLNDFEYMQKAKDLAYSVSNAEYFLSQGEYRMGYYLKSMSLFFNGSVKDSIATNKKCYDETDCLYCGTQYGKSFKVSDPKRWKILLDVADEGYFDPIMDSYNSALSTFYFFYRFGRLVTLNVGKYNKGYVVHMYIHFYHTICNIRRVEIFWWTLIGTRLGVVKDVRKKIVDLIYNSVNK